MENKPSTEKQIFLFTEHRQGAFTDTAFDLVGEGKRLCKKLNGGRLSAFALGPNVEETADALGSYGIRRIYVLEHPSLAACSSELGATLISEFIEQESPNANRSLRCSDCESNWASRLSRRPTVLPSFK